MVWPIIRIAESPGMIGGKTSSSQRNLCRIDDTTGVKGSGRVPDTAKRRVAPELKPVRGLASDKAILHIKSFDWTPPRILPKVPYPRRSGRPAHKIVEATAVLRIVRIQQCR